MSSLPAQLATIRRFAMVAVCALVLSAMLPGTARASCGDWLADPTLPENAPHGKSMHGHSGESVPRPCHGPNCRRSPDAPLPAPAPTTTSLDQDRWCRLLAVELPTSPAVARWLATETLYLPEGLALRIDRPPRG